MKKRLTFFLLFFLLYFSYFSLLSIKAETSGSFIHYVKLGYWKGSDFIETEVFPVSFGLGKVEIWTVPTGPFDNGQKVATGDVGKNILLPPGKYRVFSRASLPDGYDKGSYKEQGCPDFEIRSGQTAICTFQAYKMSDSRNYEGIMPSSVRPSGAPPFIEEDASLGSYQFVKNIVDISSDDYSSKIIRVGFLSLYNKKVMIVLEKQVDSSTKNSYQPYYQYSYIHFISFYDISNPFSPVFLRKNILDGKVAGFSNIGSDASFVLIDNFPFIYWHDRLFGTSLEKTFSLKINPDWSVGPIEEFVIKDSNLEKKGYILTSIFSGFDGINYGLALDSSDETNFSLASCSPVSILKFENNNSIPIKVAEINQKKLNCFVGVAKDEFKSFWWKGTQIVRKDRKIYALVPTTSVTNRLHVVERSWISVFDLTNPLSPQLLGIYELSGLNNQFHFPDASEVENIKVYADAGIIEVDKVTGYLYDIFPHMYDFQNAQYLIVPGVPFGETGGLRRRDIFFNLIKGPFRYRNGVIIHHLNSEGKFEYLNRYTLCEGEGGTPYGSSYHRVTCGDSNSLYRGRQKTFDRAFYGLGEYINNLPSAGIHAFNGVLLLKDLSKFYLSGGEGIAFRSPTVASLMVNNKLKVIPDTTNEFMKFKDSLNKIVTTGNDYKHGLLTLDAHLQQVDDKTFAIFQIHPASIDVVKLTLTQPRPMPSVSEKVSPDTIIEPSATGNSPSLNNQSVGDSSIEVTLYSIRSILNNLKRILNKD